MSIHRHAEIKTGKRKRGDGDMSHCPAKALVIEPALERDSSPQLKG